MYTDNNPLTYILTTAKLDATRHRWIASLANYNFKIFYRSGKVNVELDALSQIPWENTLLDYMEPVIVKTMLQSKLVINVEYTRDVSTTKGHTKKVWWWIVHPS